MPYVNIKITNEHVKTEKKEQLIQGVTQLLVDVLNQNPETTVVVIEEVATDNWGIGGKSVNQSKKRREVKSRFIDGIFLFQFSLSI